MVFDVAKSVDGQNWLSTVTAWQSSDKLPHPIPDIGLGCSVEVATRKERANLLQRRRQQYVKPVLDDL